MCASPILTHCGLTAILCVCVSVWRNISVLGQISVSSGLFPLSFMCWRFLYLVLFYASWIKYTLTFSGVKLIVMSWNDAYLICKHCLLLLSLESEHYIIKKTNNNLKMKIITAAYFVTHTSFLTFVPKAFKLSSCPCSDFCFAIQTTVFL